jgi:hypothetical protein
VQGVQLRFPPSYTYRARTTLEQLETPNLSLVGSADGHFDGLDLISLRGVRASGSTAARAEIRFSTAKGGRVAYSVRGLSARTADGQAELAGGNDVEIVVNEARLRDINAVLRSIVYVPPRRAVDGRVEDLVDELRIEVGWGEEKVEERIAVRVPAPPTTG